MIDPVGPAGLAGQAGALDAPGRAKPAADAGAIAGESFSEALARLSLEAVDKLQAGEAAAVAGIENKASTREVVDAVMTAEQSLQTVIAIRDKIVSAYLEMSRMQI